MDQLTYLNTAGTGLLSAAALRAAADFQQKTTTDPSSAFLDWLDQQLPRLRKDTARLFDTRADQIAFAPNFSFALSAVIGCLAGRVRKVLLYQNDYPSLTLPFELGPFDLHYVNDTDGFHISTEEIIAAIDRHKIEVVALTHVQFLSGFKLDIQKIADYCRKSGTVFIVDGSQSMGAVPMSFDRLPIDVLISSCYKWLNGGFGSAVLCIKKHFIDQFPPRIAGYGSMDKTDGRWQYRPSYKSFEPGHLNPPALLQLHEGIREKLERGLEAIYSHNNRLVRRLHDKIATLPFEIVGNGDLTNRLHILVFKAPETVAAWLKQNGCEVTWRRDTIRVSPHFYNTEADIDRFADVLKKAPR